MKAERIYLDHNATAPVRPEAAEAVASALALGGNPSSVHGEGRTARKLIEAARERVAALVGGRGRDVTFTSGATEALNLALSPYFQNGPVRLLISATEHVAALRGHRFPDKAVTVLPVLPSGLIDLEALKQALDDYKAPAMLALQVANNETGVIQPLAEAARLVHERRGMVVADAAQAAGKIPLNMHELGADIVVLSAHKFGGPAGVGALVRGRCVGHMEAPVLRGGGQEGGWRAGTENLSGIAGFGAAAESAQKALTTETERLATLRDALEEGLRAINPATVVFGAEASRLPNTCAFAVPGIPAEIALMSLDLEGVAVSSGSACSSGKVRASHVLEAMNVSPDLRGGMIRVSLGWNSVPTHVERFLEIWRNVHANLYKGERTCVA